MSSVTSEALAGPLMETDWPATPVPLRSTMVTARLPWLSPNVPGAGVTTLATTTGLRIGWVGAETVVVIFM